MKISKVDHYRTGVNGKNEISGFIYVDPVIRGSKPKSIAQQVGSCIKKGQVLYHIFNTVKVPKTNSESPEERARVRLLEKVAVISQCTDQAFDSLKKTGKVHSLTPADFAKGIKSAYYEEKARDVDLQAIEYAVEEKLRKTLYIRAAEGAKVVLRLGFGLAAYSDLGNKEITEAEKFLKALESDYRKDTTRNQIEKSIQRQNMLLQPDADGRLEFSKISAGSRKEREKEAFNRFLLEYSDLDAEKRLLFLQKLRRILDLYFYGVDSIISGPFDVWNDHNEHKQDKTRFIKEAVDDKASRYIKKALRNENMLRYRQCLKETEQRAELFFDDKDINAFWIHHIENSVERIYTSMRLPEEKKEAYQLTQGYLGEKVWKELLNYLSIKYIALGKAIYHFALPDDLVSGDFALAGADDHISSFDYELIKAEETFQRNTAVYVAFAAEHLSNAAVNLQDAGGGEEDFLLWDRNKLEKYINKSFRRDLLQFFGGASQWTDFSFGCDDVTLLENLL